MKKIIFCIIFVSSQKLSLTRCPSKTLFAHICKQFDMNIIIIFIQEFGTLSHEIRHETMKIKHNTLDKYHRIKSHWIKLNAKMQ